MTGMQMRIAKENTMTNRLESRVAKLERVVNVSRGGCIVYYENVECDTVVNADGDNHEVFVGGDFTIDGNRMDIDKVNAHLIDREYQAAVYLPMKQVPIL